MDMTPSYPEIFGKKRTLRREVSRKNGDVICYHHLITVGKFTSDSPLNESFLRKIDSGEDVQWLNPSIDTTLVPLNIPSGND